MSFIFSFNWKFVHTFFSRLFNGIPEVMVPMMWFKQTIELTEELANQAKVVNFNN